MESDKEGTMKKTQTLLSEKQRLIDQEVNHRIRRLREEAIKNMAPLCPQCGNPNGMERFIREDFYREEWEWDGLEFWRKLNCPDQVFIACFACRGHNAQAPNGYERMTLDALREWISETNT